MNDIDLTHSLIFVVDDILSTVDSLCMFLEFQPYHVRQFISGEKMLDVIRQEFPDLIILDIMMPDMDGYEVCKRLKADERTRDIPVMFITVKSEREDKLKGFDVGGVDYITKPFDNKEVLARVKTHLTLRKQQIQLEELNASKNKFFSIISHDVKNMLHVSHLFVELLMKQFRRLPEHKIEEHLLKVDGSLDRLDTLLGNLLIWASLQRGVLKYIPEPVNLSPLTEEIFFLAQGQAEQKGITLTNLIPAPIIVEADPNMLNTILRNLLSNALKFTSSSGSVEVSARVAGQHVEIHVSDTGVGIDPERLASLFHLDTRHQARGTAGESGTGLGLLLCKELIEQHGSHLEIESEVGKGTTFTFTLKSVIHTEHKHHTVIETGDYV